MARNGSAQDIADYLTEGYFDDKGETVRHFGSHIGKQIDVDLRQLNGEGRQLARWAMDTWEQVADVDFRIVNNGRAELVFSDDKPGAMAGVTMTASGEVLSAEVSIGKDFLKGGTTIDSYSFRTYMHEIGHVLGLGHAGDYNESANFKQDAIFNQDSWQLSIMSYFGQDDNPNVDATRASNVTPMEADILAIRELWGAPDKHYADGDTVWGRGTTLDNWLGDMFRGMEKGDSDVWAAKNIALYVEDFSGHDLMDFSETKRRHDVTLAEGTVNGIMGGKGNMIFSKGTWIEDYASGGAGDRITGNNRDNKISTNGGKDEIRGEGGSDRLNAGDGDDKIWGNSGQDRIYAGTGHDRVKGGWGQDIIYGGYGDDWIKGENNSDVIRSGGGDDKVWGNAGRDRIDGGLGHDRIYGGFGSDKLDGGAGNDTIEGGNGNDRISGESGTDEIYGGSRGDEIDGGLGSDRIEGGSGSDVIDAGGGDDRVWGGTRDDRIDGGDGDDRLWGNQSTDVLFGRNGDDRLYGGQDNDRLFGGNGNDLLEGGSGNDLLEGGTSSDTLRGGSGNDRLVGGAGNELLTGGSGSDVFVLTSGRDRITDFELGRDEIRLDVDAIWGRDGAPDADELMDLLERPRTADDGNRVILLSDEAKLVVDGIDDYTQLYDDLVFI